MSKTWYGHYIETIKGTDYVLFKDYLELDKEIERLNNIINGIEKWLKEEYEGTIFDYHFAIEDVLNKLQELKGSE